MNKYDIISSIDFNPTTYPITFDIPKCVIPEHIEQGPMKNNQNGSASLWEFGYCVYNALKACGMQHDEKKFLSFFGNTIKGEGTFYIVGEYFWDYYMFDKEKNMYVLWEDASSKTDIVGRTEYITANKIIEYWGQEKWDDLDRLEQAFMLAVLKFNGVWDKSIELVGQKFFNHQVEDWELTAYYQVPEFNCELGRMLAEELGYEESIENVPYAEIDYDALETDYKMEHNVEYIRWKFGNVLYKKEYCGYFEFDDKIVRWD